ncbi:MAG: glycosyltransferase family 39 protein [bacterium]
MSNKTKIILWFVVILFLTPILFFPMSPDTSIYLDSGKIIANGGKIYVDSIDLKQPLIYYIFALIYLVLGYSELSARIFDFIWQFATIISLFYLIRKTINHKTAFISSMIYAVSYTALNYSQTMQCESFIALPLLWLIFTRVHLNDKFSNLIISGLLMGIITGFKFTLGLILIAVMIDIALTSGSLKIYLKNLIIFSFASITGLLISMSPLLDSEIFTGYSNILKYLSYYSSITSFNFDSLKIMLTNTGNFFGDRYSLLLTIGFSVGLFLMLKNLSANRENVQTIKIMNISFLLMFFLFITVVWEGKYWDYHFSRLYIPVIIFTSIGLSFVFDKLTDFYKSSDYYFKTILITFVFAAFLFSPFSRWINTVRKEYYYFNDTEKYDSFYTELISDKLIPLRIHYKELAKIINDNMRKNDFVMVITTGSNTINYFLNTDKISRFRNAQFIFNSLNISDWQNAYLKELNKADWIIIQTDDSREEIIGQNLSSYDLFKKDTKNYKYLNENFILFETVGNFHIFRRKSNVPEN